MDERCSEQELASLRESLIYLHVEELRDVTCKLRLDDKGNKMALIMRILHFVETGDKLNGAKFPESACAKKGEEYPLELNGLMVKGAFKNDLKTRLFFKKEVGEHFHFTAFGIDWLNELWMLGTPPTYQEFVNMWQVEYKKREETPASPKEEWAYIRFIQSYLAHSPNASRGTLVAAWETERQHHKDVVKEILRNTIGHSY